MIEGAGRFDEAILVVEDDRDVAGMLRTYLELQGYAVTVAADAEQALAQLVDRRPRVAVLDAHLPGRSGLDLAREVKAQGSATGIIIYTAGMASEHEAQEAGADRFLLKTAPLSELRQMVETLGAQRTAGEHRASV